MLSPAMRARLRPLAVTGALAAALALTACGSQGIELDSRDEGNAQLVAGARLFDQRCSACHTLEAAGGQGSAVVINDREYKDGPNFNERKEDYQDILYAIRNGGFSSGPMPQNIVTGNEAEQVARFLERYSGRNAARTLEPGQAAPRGFQDEQGTPQQEDPTQ